MLEPLTAGLAVLLALLCALVWAVFRANAATLAAAAVGAKGV